jgi:hypothetical protein
MEARQRQRPGHPGRARGEAIVMKILRQLLHKFDHPGIDHRPSDFLSLPMQDWASLAGPDDEALRHDLADIDPLLVSCPNHGGLVLVDGRQARVVDRANTTGVHVCADGIARATQKDGVSWYAQGRSRYLPFEPEADLHDVLWHDHVLYVVKTGANQVLAEHTQRGLKSCWTFPGSGDAWHLNCLGVVNGRVLVSAFGEFPEHRGYKGKTKGAGVVMDLHSGTVRVGGLSQPHSLIGRGGSLWLCNSEEQELLRLDNFKLAQRIKLHGYPRGLALSQRYIYVGISNSRNAQSGAEELDGEHSQIVVLRRDNLARQGTIQIPFPEIYGISLASTAQLRALPASGPAMIPPRLPRAVAKG